MPDVAQRAAPDSLAQAAGGGAVQSGPRKLLQVEKLCASYGATRVLTDLDFSLEAGHITAILGANGAGKTTTLRALCQTVRTSGREVLRSRKRTSHSVTVM